MKKDTVRPIDHADAAALCAAFELEELAGRIRVLWNRAFLLAPPSFPRGVARFRNIEEANAARERATLGRMRARGRNRHRP
jgi:hypothetical protein